MSLGERDVGDGWLGGPAAVDGTFCGFFLRRRLFGGIGGIIVFFVVVVRVVRRTARRLRFFWKYYSTLSG